MKWEYVQKGHTVKVGLCSLCCNGTHHSDTPHPQHPCNGIYWKASLFLLIACWYFCIPYSHSILCQQSCYHNKVFCIYKFEIGPKLVFMRTCVYACLFLPHGLVLLQLVSGSLLYVHRPVVQTALDIGLWLSMEHNKGEKVFKQAFFLHSNNITPWLLISPFSFEFGWVKLYGFMREVLLVLCNHGMISLEYISRTVLFCSLTNINVTI